MFTVEASFLVGQVNFFFHVNELKGSLIGVELNGVASWNVYENDVVNLTTCCIHRIVAQERNTET